VSNRIAEPTRVWVVAHRGASADRPENTVAAFDEALQQGCDAIELDLRLSSDGVVVVFHDDTLEKLGDPERRVRDLQVEELRAIDCGSWFDSRFAGAQIPTLDEVLGRYASRTRLLLEIKDEADDALNHRLVRATVERVREHEAVESVFILSFSDSILAAVAEVAPNTRRVLNHRPLPRLGEALRRRLSGLTALCVDVRTLTTPFGRAVGEAGLPLWVYTCNGPRRVARALAAGSVAIVSDRPGWLSAELAAQGMR
jgi:glycerophosphoryl diester phosphodiesterase